MGNYNWQLYNCYLLSNDDISRDIYRIRCGKLEFCRGRMYREEGSCQKRKRKRDAFERTRKDSRSRISENYYYIHTHTLHTCIMRYIAISLRELHMHIQHLSKILHRSLQKIKKTQVNEYFFLN